MRGLFTLKNVHTRETIRTSTNEGVTSAKVAWRMLPCDTLHSNATWMTDLLCLGALTLAELTLPGTHNSAVYAFQEPLSLSPDAPSFLHGSALKSALNLYPCAAYVDRRGEQRGGQVVENPDA